MKSLAKLLVAVGLLVTALSSFACEGGGACRTGDNSDPAPKLVLSR